MKTLSWSTKNWGFGFYSASELLAVQTAVLAVLQRLCIYGLYGAIQMLLLLLWHYMGKNIN